jgi:hypothetical protein
MYSFSCSVENPTGPVTPPSELAAKLQSCTSEITRLKTKTMKAKIEEWRLPGDVLMIEVSRNGSDTTSDLEAFQHEIAAPLLKAGIKPSDRSKTELGRDCP